MSRKAWIYSLFVVAIAIGVGVFYSCRTVGPDEARRLDVYNWPYYITPTVLQDFEKECNCKVNYKEFPSNEALLTALEGKTGDWDLVFPTGYMVEILARKGLLKELDKSKLSNLKNLDPGFLKQPFDSQNKYSLPYIWGSTGIGYNKKFVNPAPVDYDVLWNSKYKDKIGLLDDIRFTIAAPLIWKSHSINTTDPSQLREAERLLLEQKQFVKAYNSENYVDLLKSEEVWLFYGYSGDIIQAIPDNPSLDFVIPKSGAAIYIDNMVIPSTSNEDDLAHKFMDYLMRPDVSAAIINSKWFAMPNKAAEPLVRKEIRENPGVYPPAEILQKCESIRDLGDNVKLYEDIWRKVKSQ